MLAVPHPARELEEVVAGVRRLVHRLQQGRGCGGRQKRGGRECDGDDDDRGEDDNEEEEVKKECVGVTL